MTDTKLEETLVVIKPDSFWRQLNHEVVARLKDLSLNLLVECILNAGENLPEEKWREFYFPAIGSKPACLQGTSKYMAFGPVHALRLKGEDTIQSVRRAVGPPGRGGHHSWRLLAGGRMTSMRRIV